MVLSATQSELGHTLDHAKLEVDGLAQEEPRPDRNLTPSLNTLRCLRPA